MCCRIAEKSKYPIILYFPDVDSPVEPTLKHIVIKPGEEIYDVKEKLRSMYLSY